MLLPPLNPAMRGVSPDDQGDILSKIQFLKRENREIRDIYTSLADTALNYHTWGTDLCDEHGVIASDKVVIHDIQNTVATATNIETRDNPRFKWEPIDLGEKPLMFWAGDPMLAARLGIPQPEFQPWQDPQTGEAKPPTALSPQSVQQVQQLIQAGQLPPDSVQEVSIEEAAACWNRWFKVIWERSKVRPVWRANCRKKNIFGWQPITFEFDDEKKRGIFRNIPIRQVFVDPTVESIDDAAYVIIDVFLDAEAAKALWPQYAKEIEDNAQNMGKVQRPSETLEMGAQYEDPTFQRPFVILTIAYLRDQPVLMTPEEATEGGHVEPQDVETGNWTKQENPDNPAEPTMTPETRTAYMHTETGTEVMPPGDENFNEHENQWPVKHATRQVVAIDTARIILTDEEYKGWDIPVCLNKCIDVDGKPFGIGLPIKLMHMQDGRSDVVTSLRDHARYFPHPAAIAPKSARDLLPDEAKDGHIYPNMVLWVDDDTLVKTGGKVFTYIEPPAPSALLMPFNDMLRREINDIGSNMDVIEGRDKTAQSGVAFGMRQNAAMTSLGYFSQTNADVLERLAQMLFYAMRTRMSAADFLKMDKRYAPHVIEQLVAMGNVDDGLEWNLKLRLIMDTGTEEQKEKDEAKDELQRGIISKETCREICGRDNGLETQRIDKEFEDQAKLQMMFAPQPQPGQSPPPNQQGK